MPPMHLQSALRICNQPRPLSAGRSCCSGSDRRCDYPCLGHVALVRDARGQRHIAMRPRPTFLLHILNRTAPWLWAVALVIALAIRIAQRPDAQIALTSRSALSSVDSVLFQTLGQPAASERILSWLSASVDSRPLLVMLAPGNPGANQTAELISYLAWPRPVDLMIVPASVKERYVEAAQGRKYAGVCFCSLHVAPDPRTGIGIGPALTCASFSGPRP